MNVKIEIEAAQFPEKEYIIGFFVAVCRMQIFIRLLNSWHAACKYSAGFLIYGMPHANIQPAHPSETSTVYPYEKLTCFLHVNCFSLYPQVSFMQLCIINLLF